MDGHKPGWGFAPGTFGELIQGQIDGTPFLITLPIFWGTRAVFQGTETESVDVWPASRRKARLAVERALLEWQKPAGGVLVIRSTLPMGKGMASSSSDIVAALRAVAMYHGVRLTAAEIARRAAEVDPTDGIMYPNAVALNPLTGTLLERLGPVPPALIVGTLGHGRINTEDHHRVRRPYGEHHQGRLREALRLVRRGIAEGTVDFLGQAGRISAEVDLEREPDEGLAEFIEVAREEGFGVIIGHSGTVRGIMLPQSVPPEVVHRLEQRLWSLSLGPVYRIAVGPSRGPWSGRLAP